MIRNTLFTLAPVALLLLSVTGGAQAASNAQITIAGNVQAATCDVNISTNNLDLGTFTPKDFTAVATPVTGSIKKLELRLSNCDAPLAAGDKAGLVVTGQTLVGHTNIFSSGNTNTGVMLSKVSTPSTYISNGETLTVATAATPPDANDFNGHPLTLQAGLATGSTAADIGRVSAPILFQFVYN